MGVANYVIKPMGINNNKDPAQEEKQSSKI